MKKTILFLLLSLSIFGCRKSRKDKIIIEAINPITGQNYPNLKWTIFATRTANKGEKIVFEDEGTLDQNGRAEIELKTKENWTYNIGCETPGNICDIKEITYTYSFPQKENPSFRFNFTPCAKLKLDIKNVSCNGASDHFKLTFLGTELDPTYLYGATIKEENGCYEFSSDYSNVPMGQRYYKWEVTKNGVLVTHYDTIDLLENESRVYQVYY